MASSAFTQILKAKHSIKLNDAVGDIQDHRGDPGKDVVKVILKSDGKSLNVTAVLKENISYYLVNHQASPVITMHFDIDNDTTTGGKPFWGKKSGFEYRVDLVACIKYKDGGLACLGSISAPIEGFCSSFKTYTYEQGKKSTKNIRSALESTQKDITGKQIEITFPYSEIDVTPGQPIRIAIREYDSSYDDKSYFPEVLFTLK